tara:strand:- start:1222 stop:1467 length:246 start_codon:yes stop_codon:yes gene_type:complete
MWHANYHSDGGQLFLPLNDVPYASALVLPGDDIRPEEFVCSYFSVKQRFYTHPNICQEGISLIKGKQNFFNKQGQFMLDFL